MGVSPIPRDEPVFPRGPPARRVQGPRLEKVVPVPFISQEAFGYLYISFRGRNTARALGWITCEPCRLSGSSYSSHLRLAIQVETRFSAVTFSPLPRLSYPDQLYF